MKEHDCVVFIKPWRDIPKGTKGTIVHVYKQTDRVVEVELKINGDTRVETVETDHLLERREKGEKDAPHGSARTDTVQPQGSVVQDD